MSFSGIRPVFINVFDVILNKKALAAFIFQDLLTIGSIIITHRKYFTRNDRQYGSRSSSSSRLLSIGREDVDFAPLGNSDDAVGRDRDLGLSKQVCSAISCE